METNGLLFRELVAAFDEQIRVELRLDDNNVTLDSRTNVPSDVVCQQELASHGTATPSSIYFSGIDQPGDFTSFGFSSTNPTSPDFLGGIPQSSGFGIITVGSL